MSKSKIAAILALVFGLLTIVSGGSALFAGLDMGAVVPFVLWFNFAAGFVYVLAGFGMLRNQSWAPWLAAGIALATLLVGLGFVFHVFQGRPFEPRTVGALILRFGVWVWIAFVVWGAPGSDA